MSPGEATLCVRRLMHEKGLQLSYTFHVKERMQQRGLIMGDMLHCLRFGDVYQQPIPANAPFEHLYKCRIECRTPNSSGRCLAVVVIPDLKDKAMKVLTIMWVDEHQRRAMSPGMREQDYE